MLTINPGTLMIEGLPAGPMTGEQFATVAWPPCPVCGTTVHVDQIDVTSAEGFTGERSYTVGRWECPNGCDPRPGHRPRLADPYDTPG